MRRNSSRTWVPRTLLIRVDLKALLDCMIRRNPNEKLRFATLPHADLLMTDFAMASVRNGFVQMYAFAQYSFGICLFYASAFEKSGSPAPDACRPCPFIVGQIPVSAAPESGGVLLIGESTQLSSFGSTSLSQIGERLRILVHR
jgi:hypothetical protein